MNVIGVEFSYTNRIRYYSFTENYSKGDFVVCNTEYGCYVGKIVTNIINVDNNKINYEIIDITRKANKNEIEKDKKNREDANNSLIKCKNLIKKHKLDMHVLSAIYTLERDRLVFFFVADARVDFRELAKELAVIYKTRIELRQLGVRDKAGFVGGVGICGRKLCCASYLKEFDSVSINMAKNQNIALNPNKINGVCGRLLCCLKYEDKTYSCLRRNMPSVGKNYDTGHGIGKVVSIDVLKKTIKVDVNSSIVEVKIDEDNQ